jgi:signal transduction histidine kinase
LSGLFVVYEIVKAHGGEVTANSASGETQFTVSLPSGI